MKIGCWDNLMIKQISKRKQINETKMWNISKIPNSKEKWTVLTNSRIFYFSIGCISVFQIYKFCTQWTIVKNMFVSSCTTHALALWNIGHTLLDTNHCIVLSTLKSKALLLPVGRSPKMLRQQQMTRWP